jgi:hypothetical protein
MRNSNYWCCLAVCAALGGIPVPASASSFSFVGILNTDDQVELFQFVAAGTSAAIRTWGYAGGINAAGTVIVPGGFDPYVALFGPDLTLQASTPLLAQNNDGTGVASDPDTGAAFDALLDTALVPISLIAGQTYFVALTQNDNTAIGPNFGNGFLETGNATFTSMFGCSNGRFCDLTAANRTAAWAVDITGVTSAQQMGNGVPEPGTALMLGAAIAGMLAIRHRNSAARHSC